MNGFLFINKPAGMTSHDVVDHVRKLTGERRVGHAGTLDPFATGLLLVAVSREATRELSRFVGLPKTYRASFVLGASSITDDVTGSLSPTPINVPMSEQELDAAIETLTGELDQIPPQYAAIKIGGVKMYEAARAGKPMEAKPRRVHITRFERTGPIDHREDGCAAFPVVIDCSSGTYIRALARDLGARLGTGGYVETLERTAIGPFSLTEATDLTDATPESLAHAVRSLEYVLDSLDSTSILPKADPSDRVDA